MTTLAGHSLAYSTYVGLSAFQELILSIFYDYEREKL